MRHDIRKFKRLKGRQIDFIFRIIDSPFDGLRLCLFLGWGEGKGTVIAHVGKKKLTEI